MAASSALTPTSRTGLPGWKRSSTSSAAASNVAVSEVGSGSVMLRVFVVNGANRTFTPTRAAGLPSARTSSATRCGRASRRPPARPPSR